MNDINVFICEDQETWREIVSKYMHKGKVTYACLFKAEQRADVIKAIENV